MPDSTEPTGALGAGLTDDELDELHDILYDYCYYGDEEIIYTEKGDVARSVLKKVENEAKRRGFWWAR